ncbi:MAG: hypothetical protein SNJ57_13565 [Cyanobacteriota bacterium]
MNAEFELKQLTLTGAIGLLTYLLTYLQYAQFQQQAPEAGAIAATLCEMLSQINQQYPDIIAEYGWQPIDAPAACSLSACSPSA